MPRGCRRRSSSSSRPATAPCSAATRNSSKRPQHPSSPTNRTTSSTARRRRSSKRSATSAQEPAEFLIGKDGTVSFLEVNTRLQVEHPVSEEITGIDLVREQFRLAEGGTLEYGDPVPQGHSIEFRINGEDPGRGFLPQPGPIHVFKTFGGPGIRLDSGVTAGDEISGAFDSLLGRSGDTGATREQALERSRRALDEFEVSGLPTVLPFHRKIVRDPAFAAGNAAGWRRR